MIAVLAGGAPPARAVPRRAPTPSGRRADIESALRRGLYEEAGRAAAEQATRGPDDAAWVLLAARAEVATGRLAQARRRLEAATAAQPDHLPLRAALLDVLEAQGDRQAWKPLVDRTYDDWAQGRVTRRNARDLLAVATAMRLDNNYKDANRCYVDAAAAAPDDPAVELGFGRLFLEKYAAGDAEVSFAKVLKLDPSHPDAHAGMARVLLGQSYDVAGATRALEAALEVNPRHTEALATFGELALDAEDWDGVAARVAQIRTINPVDAGAAWLAAARALLLDDKAAWERERRARLDTNPHDGRFFFEVAEALVRHRRYTEARAVAEEGLGVAPDDAACLFSLGQTLLRLGDESDGLPYLRKAFKEDPYNVRNDNLTNKLYGTVIPRLYTTIDTAHFKLRVEKDKQVAIREVVAPFLEDVYRGYVRKYGFDPKGPIVIELYGRPQDYAARTVGLPQIGMSAVCFGRVITSQAPQNGAFNWGMVLAHELAHVFAIELSRSRVPRWFTEGLSEVETMRLRPEWERHQELEVWAALHTGGVPGLADLSRAFTSARTLDEAGRAYAYGALVMDFLERRFGFPAIREALAAYGRGERGPAVLERLAHMKIGALEAELRRWLDGKLAVYDAQYLPSMTLKRPRDEAERVAARAPGDATLLVEAGLAELGAGDLRAARATMERVRALKDADRLEPVMFLGAELALAARQADEARGLLEALLERGRDGTDIRSRLALVALQKKNPAEAEAHLRRAIALDPTGVAPRALLIEALGALGDTRAPDRLALVEETLRLEPQSAKLAKELVLAHARAGRSAKVIDTAPLAVFTNPADADVHAAWGRALAAARKPGDAARELELALLLGSADAAEIHARLVGIYDTLGRHGDAARHRDPSAARPD